ncbi:hypothetical protein C8R47DRAFT_1168000 [Mycena vitilis]|nr:hypothetical protein C8R47DRAFT_1168000 [Mycena vitilis]
MIRLGTPLNTVNSRGRTPLLQGLERMSELHAVLSIRAPNHLLPQQILEYRKGIENVQARLRYMVVVLIKQQADVNTSVQWRGNVVSSLHFVCSMEGWELVGLLLEHGAQTTPTLACAAINTSLATNTARRRFASLQANAIGITRPPRLCPCFSGRPVADCHSKWLPYPDHFICSCGSTKEYAKCCKARKIELAETRDEGRESMTLRRRIRLPDSQVPAFVSPETRALLESCEGKTGMKMEEAAMLGYKQMTDPKYRARVTEGLELTCRQGKIADPAFNFAYLETAFFPSPQGRTSSKHYCRQRQKEWNAAVLEKYISSGVDARPVSEIEEAAKVGVSLGAMYRAYEADGCGKVEGRNIEKVFTCAGCQMTFYCSPRCQRMQWAAHKPLCGA